MRLTVYKAEEYPVDSDLILVAIIPSPRDLEIARVLGWYRVPLQYAPKIIRVDFLAFYQPASFSERHRWRIEYVAAVRGVELTTRKELLKDEPEHPRADEEYFKIEMGPLIAIKQPMYKCNWKRITFFYTTGDLLLRASCVDKLIIKDAQREILWKTIRERIHKESEYSVETLPEDMDILKYLGELQLLAEKSTWYKTI